MIPMRVIPMRGTDESDDNNVDDISLSYRSRLWRNALCTDYALCTPAAQIAGRASFYPTPHPLHQRFGHYHYFPNFHSANFKLLSPISLANFSSA